MIAIYILVALVVLAVVVVLINRDKSEPIKRGNLLYGYYGCHSDQVAEVTDHTNLHWQPFWNGIGKDGMQEAIYNIRRAQKFTVLDVEKFIFYRSGPKNIVLNADPYTSLRDLFNRLRDEGVLHLVKMIVPCDEPNLPENQAEKYLPDAVKTIRAVAAEYSELEGVLLGVIYYSRTTFSHMDLFDVVSYDDYDRGAEILAPDGDYERFRASLKPAQRTMLVPGGSFGQSPQPFVDYAMRNPEILAVIPFLWWYPDHGGEIKSIRDLPVRQAHIDAGRQVIGS